MSSNSLVSVLADTISTVADFSAWNNRSLQDIQRGFLEGALQIHDYHAHICVLA